MIAKELWKMSKEGEAQKWVIAVTVYQKGGKILQTSDS